MKLISRSAVKPFKGPGRESVFQFTARHENKGASKNHSMALMALEAGSCSDPHTHIVAEETFYITQGSGQMIVADQKFPVSVGDSIFIQPGERHQLINTGNERIECVIATSPPWCPEDSF
ncbi:MAG: cupin domain-containing protein [Pseudobdellovibrionaceae bacterium]